MDNIVTLIIVIIIVVSSVISEIKKRQKTQKGLKTEGGGWFKKLDAFLTDIQNRLEQQSKESSTGGFDWSRLRDGGDANRSRSDADEEVVDELVFEEIELPLRPKEKPPEAPDRIRTVQPVETPVPSASQLAALHAGKPSHAAMAVSRAELRKAVIWSEILGPPMALRDQLSGRR